MVPATEIQASIPRRTQGTKIDFSSSLFVKNGIRQVIFVICRMSSGGEKKGKKRTKAFYRKSAYGGKRSKVGANVLEPGIKGFLVMCNSNESNAVKESYNILNEYADLLYGQEQVASESVFEKDSKSSEDSECDDVEMAMKKEIDGLKKTSTQRRFQNVQTKAKNCVFIRTTIENPVKMAASIMEDIAERRLKKARFAARILPIIGTCKAHTSDIEKLASDVLHPFFSKDSSHVPSSYTIMFKTRNNNTNTCSKTSVIPSLTKVVSAINPDVKFSWSDFDVAVLVEVVCTVCCLGFAPSYIKLRKYNLQELQQGPKSEKVTKNNESIAENAKNGITEVTDKQTDKENMSVQDSFCAAEQNNIILNCENINPSSLNSSETGCAHRLQESPLKNETFTLENSVQENCDTDNLSIEPEKILNAEPVVVSCIGAE